MADPKHPTNPDWVLFDPEIHPPPKGAELLLLNEGETLILGSWYTGALAWGYKPTIPQSVKDRNAQKARALTEKIFPDSNPEEQFGKEVGKLVQLEFDKYLADPIAYDKLSQHLKTIDTRM